MASPEPGDAAASRAGALHGSPARIESLGLIEIACWQELQRAATERGHGWRALTLATWDGAWAQARTVTLREVDPKARELVVYADDRSPKLAQLRRHPQGTLLAWCPALSWQVRARVRLSVEDDPELLRSRWSVLRFRPQAQDYLSPLAPGDVLAEPSSQRGSREHFAMVRAQVVALDWLELHADGHRRALFDAQGGRWIQP
jgi:pyridoxamine 5'-phosphate oxidase